MSTDIDQKISQKLTEMVYQSGMGGQISVVVNAMIMAYLMQAVAPASLVLGWLAFAVIQALLRMGLLRLYASNSYPDVADITWQRWYFLGVCLSGVAWGAAVILFMPGARIEQQFFIAFVIAGMVAGGASVLAPLLKSYYCYALLQLVPLIIMLCTGDTTTHQISGVMAILFGLLVMKGAKTYHSTLCEALRLGFEKSDLAQNLDEARVRAESASQVKGAFLANMSHELRTPLNGVMGLTELLLQDTPTPKQRDYLQLIRTSSKNLLLLVNDVLDFSKLEAGRLDFETIVFDLRDAVTACLRILPTRENQQSVRLQFYLAPNTPVNLLGDPARLSQVLLNLLSNALKFTSNGFVRLEISVIQQMPEKIRLRFCVSDSGIGIPSDKLNLIFDPFTQADSSTTRRYGGTGLGLAISCELVERMGGRIYVCSELNAGSTFAFCADFGLAEAAVNSVLVSPENQYIGYRVLLAMGDSSEADYYQILLTSLGVEVLRAFTLEQTHQNLQELDNISLVLVDQRLVDKETIAVLSSNYAAAAIVLFAEQWNLADAEFCQQAGLCDYLQTPLSLRDVDALLAAVASKTEDDLPVNPLITPATETEFLPLEEAKMRILLVEDTVINQTVAKAFLSKLGYEILIANNGAEALELLAQQTVNLILMDIHMPVMDGFQATSALRAREKAESLKRTPIIALTADALEGSREQMLAAGMDEYVSKPVNFKELETVILRFLT